MLSHTLEHPTTTVAGLEVNTLADGFFHLAMFLLLLAASVTTIAAWRRGRPAPIWSFHFGLVLAGWGIFNVVEGVIDYHLLQVHHVRDDLGGPLSWDIGFLIVSALLIAAGWRLHRRGVRVLQGQRRHGQGPQPDVAAFRHTGPIQPLSLLVAAANLQVPHVETRTSRDGINFLAGVGTEWQVPGAKGEQLLGEPWCLPEGAHQSARELGNQAASRRPNCHSDGLRTASVFGWMAPRGSSNGPK